MSTTTLNTLPHSGGSAGPALRGWIAGMLNRLSTKQASAPVSGSPDRAIFEAANLRRLASSYLRNDPGFAADLFAAADRHERMNGA